MSVVKKTVAAALLILATGVPVLDTWEALLLAVSALALVFSTCKAGWRRIGAATGVVITVIALKAALPRADIAEADNAFLVINDGEPLERGLPPDIFRSWKAQFDALYPPAQQPSEVGHWRHAGVPSMLFAPSADAIWRRAKYTRQVDAIDFRSLGEFRGGFANDQQLNWWTGDLRRESMPFYVMYELTPASVGSSLAWKGQVFWQRAGGDFEEIVHPQIASREIRPEDAGKRVYAAFFSTPGSVLTRDRELYFRMEPSLTLRMSGWLGNLLTLIGVGCVVLLTVTPLAGPYLRALALFAGSYAFMMSFIWISLGKYIGKTYPPQGGGDDGFVHDGLGRMMAMLAGRGELVKALEGFEPVYWFTPGTRYVRMAEKIVFGDTNHLYALLIPCVSIALFYLIRHFLGSRWAWGTTAVFVLMPAGNLSFLQYIANAKLGYGEAIASGLFLLGLVLMLRTLPDWGGDERNLVGAAVAGVVLALSMIVRPNFAFAVVWLGAAYAWAFWKRRDVGAIVAVAAGLAVALWLPFHNWFYGGGFYLISKSGATISIPIGVRDYAAAVSDVLHGRLASSAIALTSHQLQGWLWNPGFLVRDALLPLAWVLHVVKLLGLLVSVWVAARWAAGRFARGTDLAVVAVASLCAHVPMLFIFSTHFRYAMLGWDLNLVVLLVWLVRLLSPALSPSRDVAPAWQADRALVP